MAIWCLFSNKNRLVHFVIAEKSEQDFNSLTFPFLADTKLHLHLVYCIEFYWSDQNCNMTSAKTIGSTKLERMI